MKKFTKIDEFKFKVEEDKHLENTIDVMEQIGNIAQGLNKLRTFVAQANSLQDEFIKWVDWYNERAKLINEAKEKTHLAVKELPLIDLPDCFSIIEVNPDNIPTLDGVLEKKEK